MVKIQGSNAAKKSKLTSLIDQTVARSRPGQAEPRDVIEISIAARLAAELQKMPEVRDDLVARVKAEIANGTYQTGEKLDLAVEKLMEELLPDL
jgi:anti-sigma28 factor (negative regulator of flagellin synthesis)